MKIYHTLSAWETQQIGRDLAMEIISLLDKNKKPAIVLALSGDLGAGKTTFTQGFLKGLGIKKRAVSPTFIIFRRYRIPASPLARSAEAGRRRAACRLFFDLYHVDAYRLKKAKDLRALGFKEILSNPKNIVLLEWPEKVKGAVPKHAIRIKFAHGKKENERKIIIG